MTGSPSGLEELSDSPASRKIVITDRTIARVLSMLHYDAIVIGSGQAGNPLSRKLADQG
jgi:hypothetical protein